MAPAILVLARPSEFTWRLSEMALTGMIDTMSGICGIINFDQAPVDVAMLHRMAVAAAHRGPDGTSFKTVGHIGMAHLALHITPESQREQQPLASLHDDVILVADARIDNRDELILTLIAEGHLMDKDATDAELILAAYQRWATDCPAQLIGDFAFAIWDGLHRRLFAARDPLAMRSLYYRIEPRRLLFATEIKQILAVPGVPKRLFEPAVGAHLAGPFGRLDWTFYKGIAQLAPGHALLVEAGKHHTWRYWDIDPNECIVYARESDYVDHFLELFKAAVQCRLRSLKPVGISLSGGMDSGSLASMAGWLVQQTGMELPRPLRAYCWAFEELTSSDERHISDGIVHHYGLSATNVPGDEAWPLRDYPDHGPDPDDPFIWPYQVLFEQTLAIAQSEGMGLVMSGDRGDEMVGDWVYDFLGLLRSGQWRTLWAELQAYSQQNHVPWHMVVKRQLIQPYVTNLASRGWGQERRWLGQLRPQRSELSYPKWIPPSFAKRIGLADIIAQSKPTSTVKDLARRQRFQRIFAYSGMRIAMLGERTHARFGVGFADPWSDRRLAHFILAVPQWVIQRVREPKRVARQAMHGIMPEAVRQAAGSIIPEALFDRGLRDRAQSTVRSLITGSRAAAYGYLDSGAVQDAYDTLLVRKPQRYDIWFPLTLEMWLRQHWT